MHFGCDRFVVEIVSPGFGIGIATKQMHRSCASSLHGLTFFCSGRACDRLATCSKELGPSCSYLLATPFGLTRWGLTKVAVGFKSSHPMRKPAGDCNCHCGRTDRERFSYEYSGVSRRIREKSRDFGTVGIGTSIAHRCVHRSE